MGIRGLWTYINRNSHRFLEPCYLQNSYLVIDGYGLAFELYFLLENDDFEFGGDYDRYAQWVSQYFDQLFKCNITPLILLDGTYEDKKMKTIYFRLRFKDRENFNVHPSQEKTFFPSLIREVFREVLTKMEVKYAQCFFDADQDIAAVARILKCPVLSGNSDFFVYDVLYIPFKTLECGITETKEGYVKRCKIYRVEKFLDSFGGLDKTLLPVLAMVLRNDYIDQALFDQFFNNLKLSTLTKNNDNAPKRFVMLLNWLRHHDLNSAIAGVLLTIQKETRPRIVKKMKLIHNGYTNSSPHMLTALGFSERYIATLKIQNPNHCFEIPEDLSSLETFAELSIKNNDSAQNDTKGGSDEILDENDNLNLSAKNRHKDKVLKYVLHSKHNKVTNYHLKKFPEKLPSLTNLNELSVPVRTRIILQTLNINAEESINKIPPEWRLYVATILFWVEQKHEPLVTNCHILALICAMLFHIIDKKIGFYRKEDAFTTRSCAGTGSVTNAGEELSIRNQYLKVYPITVAYDAVTEADCLAAAPFFISNFTTNPSIIRNPDLFNVTTVQCFAQFQSCLKHTMGLNALLGYPYQQPKVAQLYNGTLIYNLCHNFQNCNDIEAYLKVVLENSPNLLQLLTLLSTFVSSLLKNSFVKKMNAGSNKKKGKMGKRNGKKEGKKSTKECMDSECDNKC